MSAASDKSPPITSALAPDLEAVKKFIADMIAKGAIAGLVAAIVALLVRMRDLNSELMKKLASTSRKRPPNETMRRLQMELPFGVTAPANDGKPAPPQDKKPKKRGAKNRPLTADPSCPPTFRACPTCFSSTTPSARVLTATCRPSASPSRPPPKSSTCVPWRSSCRRPKSRRAPVRAAITL
jgi:hypothetical protein